LRKRVILFGGVWGSRHVPIRRATHSLYRGKVPSGRWCFAPFAVRRKGMREIGVWGKVPPIWIFSL
ncbi:MAG: hypothetical protein AAGK10_22330, partial [Cyanobacteria bacterium J06555_3]